MQKIEPNEDLRIRRTRQLLQKAMVELTVEKGFDAITVRDITERAQVNRSTFYRHYLDKVDLLDKYMEEVYAMTSVPEIPPDQDEDLKKGVPRGLLSMLLHVQDNADFYRVMLGPNGDPAFADRFRYNTKKRFTFLVDAGHFPVDPDGPPVDLRLSYVAYAGVCAIVWWLDNHHKHTPEQLARWMSQLSTASMGLMLQTAIIPEIPVET